eukprot:gene11-biopygen13565
MTKDDVPATGADPWLVRPAAATRQSCACDSFEHPGVVLLRQPLGRARVLVGATAVRRQTAARGAPPRRRQVERVQSRRASLLRKKQHRTQTGGPSGAHPLSFHPGSTGPPALSSACQQLGRTTFCLQRGGGTGGTTTFYWPGEGLL